MYGTTEEQEIQELQRPPQVYLNMILRGHARDAEQIGRGGERDVFGIRHNTLVGKIERDLSNEDDRREKKEFQEDCRNFFPAEAVRGEFFAKQNGRKRSVSIQKMIPEMFLPDRLALQGGYAEKKKNLATETYVRVSERSIRRRQSIPYDRSAFLAAHANPELTRLLASVDADAALKEKVEEFLTATLYFAQQTNHGVDCMGASNVIFYPDAHGWHYLLSDPKPPGRGKLLVEGTRALEKYSQGHGLSDDEWVALVNCLNFARIVNSLADELHFNEEEMIHLPVPRLNFEQLHHDLRIIVPQLDHASDTSAT